MVAIPIYYYGDLPEIIPHHFDLNGNPDGYSNKGTIWLLPIIGIATYFGMAALNKYPHTFNYSKKIIPQNAERQYKAATKMIRVLNTSIVCFFAMLTFFTTQIALGRQSGIEAYYLYGFLTLILGITGYYIFKSLSKTKLIS